MPTGFKQPHHDKAPTGVDFPRLRSFSSVESNEAHFDRDIFSVDGRFDRDVRRSVGGNTCETAR